MKPEPFKIVFLKLFSVTLIAIFCSAYSMGALKAKTLGFDEQVSSLLENHPRINAAEQAIVSLKEGLSVAAKAWYPDLALTGNRAKEVRNNAAAASNTSLPTREVKLTLTQPVYDFGSRSAGTQLARLQIGQAEKTLELTRQSIVLEIGVAQIGVSTAAEKLRFSRKSLLNLKRQTKLENIKVKRGAGVSTDVLQAKVQLAGAQARVLAAEGQMRVQENRYRTVFGDLQNQFLMSRKLRLPEKGLPKTVDDAIEMAKKNNLQLQSLNDAISISKTAVKQVKSDQLFPKISFVFDKTYKKNVGGTVGNAQELIAKLQFTYNFNLGFSSLNSIKAAKANYIAAQRQLDDARRLIVEAVGNAFWAHEQAKENAELLEEQAALSSAFLELARKERKLGKRSLIEILSGETAEINANSDAAEANGAVISSALALLSTIGVLDASALKLK
jgi:adhesin transport system outer membrane protein